MIRNILIFFGLYDFKTYGKEWCLSKFGKPYDKQFQINYEKMNNGIPIGGYIETITFLELVNEIKRELYSKCFWRKFKKNNK